jgi:predicted methyltransferase
LAGFDYRDRDEFIVSHADAATLLKDNGRRSFEIVEDFETDAGEPPEGTISIERRNKNLVERKVEAAGIEPASADAPDRTSTSVVRALASTAGR